MVEVSGLVEKLKVVNGGRQPAHTLYLYGDSVYYTVYGIMRSYKNYLKRLQTVVLEKFNKAMSKLWIGVEHSFAINQNS